jgi:asparagine synthase (glutamine-hydrolysing)
MVNSQSHRGPDRSAHYIDEQSGVYLGHNRLRIIDLSAQGDQPMYSADGTLVIVFNGEIYNYQELRTRLSDYPFSSNSDTEVILAAYQKWGVECLNEFIGMFSLAIWNKRDQSLFCARDRFGVKPFYYHISQDKTFVFASEIKAIHAAGVPKRVNEKTWANYLFSGTYDHSAGTFWEAILNLPGGHYLLLKNGSIKIQRWYHFATRIANSFDLRDESVIEEEYMSLLVDSIKLRFRADVPVGINLSGGLDSSILLGLVDFYKGKQNEIKAFTFSTDDENYDEVPWAKMMIAHTRHPHEICTLRVEEVPALAEEIQRIADEPFGGFPTLAYSKIFERARQQGVIVLLDGQGLDEQWAGYEYYAKHLNGNGKLSESLSGPVQAGINKTIGSTCLSPDFAVLANTQHHDDPFADTLRNAQYRDAFYTKIPRALRFNDRISMLHSTELREPFLDHRLFELAFCLPPSRKIYNGVHKYLLRRIASKLLPGNVATAPKRPVQTPQREWLKGPLQNWVTERIAYVDDKFGGSWFKNGSVTHAWKEYQQQTVDNSFFLWQWISLAMIIDSKSK